MEGNPKVKSTPKNKKWPGREPALSPPASGEKAKVMGLILKGLRSQLALQK